MEHTQAVTIGATERYLLGELDEQECAEFEEHYFSCAECAADVRAASAVADGATLLLRDGPRPGAEPRPGGRVLRGPASWFWPVPMGAAAALVLACAGLGWQGLVVRGLNQDLAEAEAPAPTHVRVLGSMRDGADPVVLPRGVPSLSLKLTVGADRSPLYHAQIWRDDALLSEFDLPHPDPTEEPAVTLSRRRSPPGAYRIVLRASAPTSGEASAEFEYRFTFRHEGD